MSCTVVEFGKNNPWMVETDLYIRYETHEKELNFSVTILV